MKGVKKVAKKKIEKLDRRLKIASTMPAVYHTLPGEKFERKKSEVLKWISECPALTDYMFDFLARKQLIVFDEDTGKWQGIDWEDDEYDD